MELKELLLSGEANRRTVIHFPNGEHEDIDSGIYSGSMKLNRILCSASTLNYGECNAASFEVQIIGINDLSGKRISVSQEIGEYRVPLFMGIIDSCKAEKNKSYRKLVAYDDFYTLLSRNVVEWYDALFDRQKQYTIRQFRDSFCGYLGLQQTECTLLNDDIVIEKTVESNTLKARDVLYAICQINVCFGQINALGEMEYIGFNTGEVRSVENNVRTDSTYEDYMTKVADRLIISTSNDKYGVSVGSGQNVYTIKGNFLLYGSSELQNVAHRIYDILRKITYRPANIRTILSEPDIRVGDKVIFEDNGTEISAFITKISLSGIQMLTQELESAGEEFLEEVTNDVNAEINDLRLEATNASVVNKMVIYSYVNGKKVTLTNEDKQIILIRYVSVENTQVEFKSSMLFRVEADPQTVIGTDGDGGTVTFRMDGRAVITFTYVINSEKVTTYIPMETLGSGKHIITLFYNIDGVAENTVNSFQVFARIEGGSADAETGAVIGTISGQGLSSEGVSWDGTIEIEETYNTIRVEDDITLPSVHESLTAAPQQPSNKGITQSMAAIVTDDGIALADLSDAVVFDEII